MTKHMRMAAVIAAGAALIATAPAMAATTTIKVTSTAAGGLKFIGMPSTLKPGTYKFVYNNASGLPHNLQVGSAATAIAAKGIKSITVKLSKGNVMYMCAVPGHSQGGMMGTIKVK